MISLHNTTRPRCKTLTSVFILASIYALTTAALRKSDALNLNWNTLGQLLSGNARSGGFVSEELLILSVHLRKVGHVIEEDLKPLLPSANPITLHDSSYDTTYIDTDDLVNR